MLGSDVANHLDGLQKIWEEICEKAKSGGQERFLSLSARVSQLLGEVQVDDSRLYTEIAVLADKGDISEELARLESHFDQCREALKAHPQGKKLEFLQQELNREFNTIASKAQDVTVKQLVVEAKVVLEKFREQIQNIE